MDITVDARVPYPREQVWTVMRDQMIELAPFLPNVESIEVLERSEPEPGTVKLLNKWKAAKTEVPTVARPFIDQSKLSWLDRATWIEPSQCEWTLEVGFMTERVKCSGKTEYVAEGDATRVKMRGQLDIELKGLLPGLIANSARPKVEAFIIKLIQPNFEKTFEAVARLLDSRKIKA